MLAGAVGMAVWASGAVSSARGAEPGDLPQVDAVLAYPNLRFDRPVAHASRRVGDREIVFVVEQNGRIVSFPNDPGAREEDLVTLLDISEKVNRDHNEEGLLGLAFHPKFDENREFVVNYSAWRPGPRRSVVSRFKASAEDPRRADRNTEEVIWESEADPFGNHNGGCVEFGPDGYLYISLGDGGAADDPLNTGQNPRDWWGSILRIDPDHPAEGKRYGIPSDNPSARSKAHAHWAPEVYAIGLRNVWKFTFDREAPHRMWAGDVGQNLYEIVHVIENGGNYGWSVMEGRQPFRPKFRQRRDPAAPLTPAITDYPHSVGQSITGGYVYRGSAIPDLVGAYVYGDFNTGRIWAVREEGGKATAEREILSLERNAPAQIAAFGQDLAGELYTLTFDGRIRKLVPAGSKGE